MILSSTEIVHSFPITVILIHDNYSSDTRHQSGSVETFIGSITAYKACSAKLHTLAEMAFLLSHDRPTAVSDKLRKIGMVEIIVSHVLQNGQYRLCGK